MKKDFCLIIVLFLMSEVLMTGQNYLRITGTVIDAETKEPIPGVTVLLKGTERSTLTQLNGEYAIDAIVGSEYLEFSFVGLKTQTIAISGRNRIDIEMLPNVVSLHEWLICGKSFVEPTISASSCFPLIIGATLMDKKLYYCCNERYNLNLGLQYGTLFTNNQLFLSRISINNISMPKFSPGVAAEYNRILLSGRGSTDTLISDYRVSLILNKLLKSIKCEAGVGRQSYNNLTNTGFGGRISILNEFDNSFPKFTYEIHSGFWYWGDYNEYSLGLNLFLNSRKSITESSLRRVRIGCELKQTDKIRFVSVTVGVRYLIKRQTIGCG
ncbi:MAG TPA: carboxypeptidase-like regulatory domain-containing protein [Bacteroidales bacterium]|nr:carboxypeptidase-like regulatory domain-containing protein [Bacteroidales bacterium]